MAKEKKKYTPPKVESLGLPAGGLPTGQTAIGCGPGNLAIMCVGGDGGTAGCAGGDGVGCGVGNGAPSGCNNGIDTLGVGTCSDGSSAVTCVQGPSALWCFGGGACKSGTYVAGECNVGSGAPPCTVGNGPIG